MRSPLPSQLIATGFIAALLLTGCSAKDANNAEAQPSETSQSATASADASKDASGAPTSSEDSGSAEASSSATALPTLANGQEVTLTDTERSDFNAGKYVPATAQHPALNVPEPVMPEVAKEQTFEGAKAFLEYWIEAKNYNTETGKTSQAKELVSPEWHEERDMYEAISQEYSQGGWLQGSLAKIETPDEEFNFEYNNSYDIIVYYSETEGALYGATGEMKEDIPAFNKSHQPTIATLVYENGHWVYENSSGIEGVTYED